MEEKKQNQKKRWRDLYPALFVGVLGARGAEERAAFLQFNIWRGFELETMQLVNDRGGKKGSVV